MFDWIKNLFIESPRVNKHLVATGVTTINWQDKKCPYDETITWYFYIDDNGLRSYDYHSYGFTQRYNAHDSFLGPILRWVKGGKLPTWANSV